MEHKTYPNSDRVGRCEFAVKTILGLALLVPCLVMTPREGTSLWYKAAALIIVPFALYMSILWMFLIARRLHDFGRTGWWILGFIVFQNVARNLAMAAPKGTLIPDFSEPLKNAIFRTGAAACRPVQPSPLG